MTLSPLELGFLAGLACAWLILNLIVTRRIARCFGSVFGYGLNYLLVVWGIPVFGALYTLSKLRRWQRTHYRPISGNTVGLDASRTGNWPSIGGNTRL